ncbi:MAG: hypothetical protein AABZ55_07830 [Bdellovibrionota bacterium]
MSKINAFTWFSLFCSIHLISGVAFAKEAVCFDAKNGFFIRTPKGWSLDTDATARLGYCAVFRKEEFNFYTSPAGIYVRLLSYSKRNVKGELDLIKFIDEDLEPFQMRTNDRAQVHVEKDWVGKKSVSFLIRVLSEGPSPNAYEKIAYHGATEAVLLVVLTVRGAFDIERFKTDFEEVLTGVVPRVRAELYKMLREWSEIDKTSREGKKYPDFFTKRMNPILKKAGQDCNVTESEPATGVLTIAKNGKIMAWIGENSAPSEDCIKRQVKTWISPKPPFAPYFLFLKF